MSGNHENKADASFSSSRVIILPMTAQPVSASRQVARAATTVMAAFIVSNLLGLLRQVLVTRAFGTSPEMEAFTAANRVSETIFALVAGGALASSFIPTFTGLLTLDKKRQAWQLASAISNLALIVLGTISLLAAVFAPQIVIDLLAPGFASDPAKVALTISLLRLMLPSAVLFGLSGLGDGHAQRPPGLLHPRPGARHVPPGGRLRRARARPFPGHLRPGLGRADRRPPAPRAADPLPAAAEGAVFPHPGAEAGARPRSHPPAGTAPAGRRRRPAQLLGQRPPGLLSWQKAACSPSSSPLP